MLGESLLREDCAPVNEGGAKVKTMMRKHSILIEVRIYTLLRLIMTSVNAFLLSSAHCKRSANIKRLQRSKRVFWLTETNTVFASAEIARSKTVHLLYDWRTTQSSSHYRAALFCVYLSQPGCGLRIAELKTPASMRYAVPRREFNCFFSQQNM